MDDYLLTRDILFNTGRAYMANLSGEARSETVFLMLATDDIDLLRRTSVNAADDYKELFNVGCQRLHNLIGGIAGW